MSCESCYIGIVHGWESGDKETEEYISGFTSLADLNAVEPFEFCPSCGTYVKGKLSDMKNKMRAKEKKQAQNMKSAKIVREKKKLKELIAKHGVPNDQD